MSYHNRNNLASNEENNMNTTTTPTSYMSICMENEIFLNRIQDVGCKESELPKKRYRMAKILSVGPEGNQVYYYNLTAIAVDFSKLMLAIFVVGSGWKDLPKNPTNVKAKIVQTCLQLRQWEDDGFILDQRRLIDTLHGLWGSTSGVLGLHDNDKVRLFGILMSLEKNRLKFQRLAEGVTERSQMDSPELSVSGIFTSLLFDFCNEDIVIELPENAADIEGIDELDPNDVLRIRTDRNCKY